MTDSPALASQLGERALTAWKAHVISLQQSVVAGELSEEHAALLQSEQAQAVWLMAFIREWRGNRERQEKND